MENYDTSAPSIIGNQVKTLSEVSWRFLEKSNCVEILMMFCLFLLFGLCLCSLCVLTYSCISVSDLKRTFLPLLVYSLRVKTFLYNVELIGFIL